MNKIDYTIRMARNIFEVGIPPREAFILCAVAKLHNQGKGEVTSHEVSELVGDSHVCSTMKRMHWWLSSREGLNSRGKKAFYYKLTEKGIEKIERIIS